MYVSMQQKLFTRHRKCLLDKEHESIGWSHYIHKVAVIYDHIRSRWVPAAFLICYCIGLSHSSTFSEAMCFWSVYVWEAVLVCWWTTKQCHNKYFVTVWTCFVFSSSLLLMHTPPCNSWRYLSFLYQTYTLNYLHCTVHSFLSARVTEG